MNKKVITWGLKGWGDLESSEIVKIQVLQGIKSFSILQAPMIITIDSWLIWNYHIYLVKAIYKYPERSPTFKKENKNEFWMWIIGILKKRMANLDIIRKLSCKIE